MAEWQAIDTAPKWEAILVYDEDWDATLGAIQIGCMDDEGKCRVPETDDFNPTHWMLLPEPPAGDIR